jgi:hypothetical protein
MMEGRHNERTNIIWRVEGKKPYFDGLTKQLPGKQTPVLTGYLENRQKYLKLGLQREMHEPYAFT